MSAGGIGVGGRVAVTLVASPPSPPSPPSSPSPRPLRPLRSVLRPSVPVRAGRAHGSHPCPADRLGAAVGQPALQLAHPVELEARGTHHHGRVGAVGLERGERLDRLAETLLVGEKRAALRQQVAHAGALKGLELAAEARHVDVAVGGRRERHEPGRVRVLLANALQLDERVGVDPHVPFAQERVEVAHAEGIGAQRRKAAVVGAVETAARGAGIAPHAPAAKRARGLRHPRARARERRERVEHRGVVTGGHHERRLVVHARQLEHRGRRRAAFLQRGHAAPRGRALGAVQAALDRAPGVERERHRGAAGGARGSFAQIGRQTHAVAEQQEHGLGGRSGHLDRAVPGRGAGDPVLGAWIDGGHLEPAEQLGDEVRVALDGGHRERPLGALERAQVGAAGEHARERGVVGGDEQPLLLAAVAAQLHVIGHRAGPPRGAGFPRGPASPLAPPLGRAGRCRRRLGPGRSR